MHLQVYAFCVGGFIWNIYMSWAANYSAGAGRSGTEFTCFTSTKVQILTPEELLSTQGLLQYGRPTGAVCTSICSCCTKLVFVPIALVLLNSKPYLQYERPTGVRIRGIRKSTHTHTLIVTPPLPMMTPSWSPPPATHTRTISLILSRVRRQGRLRCRIYC